jgi:NADH-quinone oxidoreductase subunit J
MLESGHVENILFHILAAGATIGAVLVVFARNPVYSALFLALTMSVLGAIFFTLNAAFVAVAQLTVYAGAVMVLFVMVLMMFDLGKEGFELLKVSPMNLLKVMTASIFCGFLIGTAWLAVSSDTKNPATMAAPQTQQSDLAKTGEVAIKATSPDEDLTEAENAALVENQQPVKTEKPAARPTDIQTTYTLSQALFTRHVFAFEAISVLLLIAIVGAVAIARSKGGTHHVS